jgi:glycosyltransferase involved in cell wall biosynthesis
MRLDIVIPAHNEEHRIDATLTAYRAVCSDPDARFLVALDDCSDRTADIVAAHALEDERVRGHRFPKLGKGGVIMETFRRSDADLMAFVDADCATPPAELLRLAATTDEAGVDGAIATRWHPAAVLPARRSAGRRLASAVFAFFVRRLFRLPFRDTQCGAKVLRRNLVERVVPLLSSRDFLFDVDLLVTSRGLGFRIVEVPTVWVDRPGSRVGLGRDSKRMAASLLRLWLHHRVLPVAPTAMAYPDEPTITAPPRVAEPMPVQVDGPDRDAHVG